MELAVIELLINIGLKEMVYLASAERMEALTDHFLKWYEEDWNSAPV